MADPQLQQDVAAIQQHQRNVRQQVLQQQQQQPRREQSTIEKILTTVSRMVLIFWIVSYVKKMVANPGTDSSSSSGGIQQGTSPDGPSFSSCAWSLGDQLSVKVFVSENWQFQPYAAQDNVRLVFDEHKFKFGDWEDQRHQDLQIPVSDNVKSRNGSLYAHILMQQDNQGSVEEQKSVYKRVLLTRFMRKKKIKQVKNLLASSDSSDLVNEDNSNTVLGDAGDIEDGVYVSHWLRNLTLNVINDVSPISLAQLAQMPHIVHHTQFVDQKRSLYLPTLYVNDFWILQEDLYDRPINSSADSLTLSIDLAHLSMWKFQMMVQMDQSFKLQKSWGTSDQESDNIKRMLYETNIYLLVITFVVSILHSVFDFLAFKNDVQFWRERKNVEGLSVRTIMLNVLMQSIVFLYLLDNETSYLIIASSGVSLLIEMWKVGRAVKFVIDRNHRSFYGVLPLTITFKSQSTAEQNGGVGSGGNQGENEKLRSKLQTDTEEYDRVAFKWLSLACIPLLLGYTVYSVMYEKHKSWYSFVVGTAVGFVYTFGFIGMTPQLFINYKLKSVAHMPWKTFMYKALNTFVDDLFAFVIKMPTLHRLACFRDDLIFLVYLYQRWIYPVDQKRPNEFGQVGADDEKSDNKDKEQLLVANGSTDQSQEDDKSVVVETKKDK
ncbi:hypothetical protein MP228_010679 [Amoeboaphelidium protococcarum]|nr:hypothetical protein MP228_010679 [Amoeboaphelidium protococcarum]